MFIIGRDNIGKPFYWNITTNLDEFPQNKFEQSLKLLMPICEKYKQEAFVESIIETNLQVQKILNEMKSKEGEDL